MGIFYISVKMLICLLLINKIWRFCLLLINKSKQIYLTVINKLVMLQ